MSLRCVWTRRWGGRACPSTAGYKLLPCVLRSIQPPLFCTFSLPCGVCSSCIQPLLCLGSPYPCCRAPTSFNFGYSVRQARSSTGRGGHSKRPQPAAAAGGRRMTHIKTCCHSDQPQDAAMARKHSMLPQRAAAAPPQPVHCRQSFPSPTLPPRMMCHLTCSSPSRQNPLCCLSFGPPCPARARAKFCPLLPSHAG